MFIYSANNVSFEANSSQSILDASLKNGYHFEHSCKKGLCGICKTTLLSGQIKELIPQTALSLEDQKNQKILTCACAAVTDISIDAENIKELQSYEVKTLPVRISELCRLSENILLVKLRYPPSIVFRFLEGQYIDIIGPNAVRRSYSIFSTSEDLELSLLIRKVDGGVLSDFWFNEAKLNDLLRIEGPFGTFYFKRQAKNIVFLATGTGLAPVLSILNSLDKENNDLQEKRIYLFWGNRYEPDFVFRPVFEYIKVETSLVLSQPEKSWKGSKGYVQDVALSLLNTLSESVVYACGSLDMIESSKKLFSINGLESKNFFSDAFVKNY